MSPAPLTSTLIMPLATRSYEKAEIEEMQEREPLQWITLGCVTFAGLVGILLGYDLGIVSAALSPIQHNFALSSGQAEAFVGFLSLFALPGCLAGSRLAEVAGRRRGIGVASVLFLIGNILMAAAWSYTSLMLGRAIAGFAMGLTYILTPLYVAEVSPSKHRGRLTTLLEVLSNVGILLGYLSGWVCDHFFGANSWRLMLGIGVAPPVAILLGVCFVMLESPRWLAAKGRMQEADQVLSCLVGPLEANAAMVKFKLQSAGGDGSSNASFQELLSSRALRRSMLAGAGVAFFSQATGCEAVMYYSPTILENAGVRRDQTLLATVVIGAVKTSAVIASGMFVDKIGRRPLLMLSSGFMSFAMALLGVSIWRCYPALLEVSALCVFVIAFSVGFGPIVYVFNAEIYAQRWRSFGLALAMGICRVLSAAVSSSFLSLSQWLSTVGVLLSFSLIAFVGLIFIIAVIPETKGTTLEEQGIPEIAIPTG